jgi:hypothetical protein
MPRAAAVPWTLAAKVAAISWWHTAQVEGTRPRLTVERGSAAGRMSWLPWQELHVAACWPCATARAWTLAS